MLHTLPQIRFLLSILFSIFTVFFSPSNMFWFTQRSLSVPLLLSHPSKLELVLF